MIKGHKRLRRWSPDPDATESDNESDPKRPCPFRVPPPPPQPLLPLANSDEAEHPTSEDDIAKARDVIRRFALLPPSKLSVEHAKRVLKQHKEAAKKPSKTEAECAEAVVRRDNARIQSTQLEGFVDEAFMIFANYLREALGMRDGAGVYLTEKASNSRLLIRQRWDDNVFSFADVACIGLIRSSPYRGRCTLPECREKDIAIMRFAICVVDANLSSVNSGSDDRYLSSAQLDDSGIELCQRHCGELEAKVTCRNDACGLVSKTKLGWSLKENVRQYFELSNALLPELAAIVADYFV